MFRKALLPALAAAMLSACATDYTYRNGNGDYYYGRPQVEYRQIGGYGGYGSYGSYGSYGGYGGYGHGGPTFYYDRFGRLVYGFPYSSYGSPYSGSYLRYQSRPQVYHHHHRHPPTNPVNPNSGIVVDPRADDARPPAWRNIDGTQGALDDGGQRREFNRARRSSSPFTEPGQPIERVRVPQSIEDEDGSPRPGARSRRMAVPEALPPASDE